MIVVLEDSSERIVTYNPRRCQPWAENPLSVYIYIYIFMTRALRSQQVGSLARTHEEP